MMDTTGGDLSLWICGSVDLTMRPRHRIFCCGPFVVHGEADKTTTMRYISEDQSRFNKDVTTGKRQYVSPSTINEPGGCLDGKMVCL